MVGRRSCFRLCLENKLQGQVLLDFREVPIRLFIAEFHHFGISSYPTNATKIPQEFSGPFMKNFLTPGIRYDPLIKPWGRLFPGVGHTPTPLDSHEFHHGMIRHPWEGGPLCLTSKPHRSSKITTTIPQCPAWSIRFFAWNFKMENSTGHWVNERSW